MPGQKQRSDNNQNAGNGNGPSKSLKKLLKHIDEQNRALLKIIKYYNKNKDAI